MKGSARGWQLEQRRIRGSRSQASAPARILRHEVNEALAALDRRWNRLFVSGLSAGLDLGFSLLLIAIVKTIAAKGLSEPVTELLVGTAYSFGFVIVVLGRSELFTEQTSLAVLPLMARQTSVAMIGRLWGIVYLANQIGAVAFAALLVFIGPRLGIIDPEVFGQIARQVVDHPWWVIFLSGVLAGWLMGLLSWLVAAGRDTISQIVIIWLITSAIGLAHFHHSVLGTTEVLAGVFSGSGVTLAQFARTLLWTTLGNAIGGPFFVALKFGLAERDPGDRDPD